MDIINSIYNFFMRNSNLLCNKHYKGMLKMKKWILKTFFKKELNTFMKEINDLQARILNMKQILNYKDEKITMYERKLTK